MKKYLFFLYSWFVVQNVFANIVCDIGVTKYSAVYKISEYTCEQGKFLPANTEGCVVCPNGYDCPGGKFLFSPNKIQGLIIHGVSTDAINNVCAVNFGKKLHAIYKPNTINLDWYNGNETVAQTSCTYDGTIQLPPVPTKPGYTFAGWRLKTTN